MNQKSEYLKIQEQFDERVEHPSHYNWFKDKCGIEVIDIARHLDFDKGNAIKYILRSGHKQEKGYTSIQKEIEDLKKAIWYLNDRIEQLIEYETMENKGVH